MAMGEGAKKKCAADARAARAAKKAAKAMQPVEAPASASTDLLHLISPPSPMLQVETQRKQCLVYALYYLVYDLSQLVNPPAHRDYHG